MPVYEEMRYEKDNKTINAHNLMRHTTVSEKNMPTSSQSSIKNIYSNVHILDQKSCKQLQEPFENIYFSPKENRKIRKSNLRHLDQNFWRTTMNASVKFLILIVISCMNEIVLASNGSSRNGGVINGGQRSNSIPQDGPYKNAQSAASVSNIVNGHYQTLEEDDEEAPPISILADSRHFASTIDDNDEGYWREVKAIIGGVLGFWGGIGSLGTLFLVVVMSKRYCCREVDDKENDKDG